jgi:hypothetical protein
MKSLRWTIHLDTFAESGQEAAGVAARLRELADYFETMPPAVLGSAMTMMGGKTGGMTGSPMVRQGEPDPLEGADVEAVASRLLNSWKAIWAVEERD